MKRVVTYGLKYSDYDRQRDLYCLLRNGYIDIVGEVAFDTHDNEIFGRRMDLNKLGELVFDCIVLCDETKADSIHDELCNLNEQKEVTVTSVEELIAPMNAEVENAQLEIIRDIVNASDEEIHDRQWLANKLFKYGFFPFFKLVKSPKHDVLWSRCGILQVPDEFVNFCEFISNLKCSTAVEVGVAGGRSSFVIAAILYRNNPELIYDLIDICDGISGFNKFKELIPALNKQIPHTSDDFVGKSYDFCFIDGNHSYNGMMTDWNNLGKYASKIVVFHDIYGHEYDHLDGGTVRAWEELKSSQTEYTIKEFTEFEGKWMGLGCLIK